MIQSYTGPYVVEPTEAGKMLSTARRTLRQNVIVSPVSPKFVGSGVRRQAATTITPTEREQIAVPKDTYTTGDVKVKAIPSDYIGADVPRKSSSDMSASGRTVTAPAGFYAEDAIKAIENATWKSASTIACVPAISVSSSGLITADASGWTSHKPLSASGYADADTYANLQTVGTKTLQLTTKAADTITPGTTNKEIAAGTYLTGTQTIIGDENLLPENIIAGKTIFNVGGTARGYSLLGSKDVTANTTSTTNTILDTLTLSDVWTTAKIIYVRVRDKAGKRSGYFFGSDVWFMNVNALYSSYTSISTAARLTTRYSTSNTFSVYSGTSYGVFGYSLTNGGAVNIYTRYNSSYSLTIDGTYKVEVYALDWPDGVTPFTT